MRIKIWRQEGPSSPGRFEEYDVDGATPQMTLLDLIDLLNEQIIAGGGEPVAYESDCHEGICGACGVTVDGRPHGPVPNTPSCRQHLAAFADADELTIEPLRSAAFPVVRDLIVDRSRLDAIIQAGGYVSVPAGTAPDADVVPVSQPVAEEALDFSACIGCGACVAACPNGSAHLFAGSKLAGLALLPYGKSERARRARAVSDALDENFGPCSLIGECAQVCPADIPLRAVAAVSRERWRAAFGRR